MSEVVFVPEIKFGFGGTDWVIKSVEVNGRKATLHLTYETYDPNVRQRTGIRQWNVPEFVRTVEDNRTTNVYEWYNETATEVIERVVNGVNHAIKQRDAE